MFRELLARFGKQKDVDSLIQDIADHRRPGDHAAFCRLLPGLPLYLPLVGQLPPGVRSGERIQVTPDMDLRTRTASLGGHEFLLVYTSSAHPDLGPVYAEIEGAEALRMTLRAREVSGLLLQGTGTGWVALDRERASFILSGQA